MTPRALLGDVLACASLFGMIYAGLLASAAFGQPAFPVAAPSPRMTVEPGGADCFATVRIENRFGVYHETEILATERGPVSIAYRTVGSHSPGNDDEIRVVSLPPDVYARPMEATIPDGSALTVCLYDWRGM
jgi:hypothetical protein